MASSVDEERRRSCDPTGVGARDILSDSCGVLVVADRRPEALDVEPKRRGVFAQMRGVQGLLRRQQPVVDLPEGTLVSGGLGGFGSHLSTHVDIVERQVAPDVAQLVSKGGQQLADDRLGLTAVWAFEVAVLDERDRGGVGAADVVACRVDVIGEVQQLAGRTRQLPSPHAVRQPPGRREQG